MTSVGTYSFTLRLAPEPQNFTIAIGDTVSSDVPEPGAGNLEAPGAQDVYSFDALAGQQVVFDVRRRRGQLEVPPSVVEHRGAGDFLGSQYPDLRACVCSSSIVHVSPIGPMCPIVGFRSIDHFHSVRPIGPIRPIRPMPHVDHHH